MNWLYLVLDIAAISIPLVFSFHPKIKFIRHWKAAVLSIVIVGFPFLIWDEIFTEWGVWGFNRKFLMGVQLGALPVEEILFFVCIPFACTFTFFSIHKLTQAKVPYDKLLSSLLIATLLTIALTHLHLWYTSLTFFLLAGLLAYHVVVGTTWMGSFYFSFLLILLPFFLINGTLTGSFIEGEVVWYNDAENLGIRMGTIPVEDTFYGMLLILGNITAFRRLSRSS
jgi:lycopene cyclase domain-containing protein